MTTHTFRVRKYQQPFYLAWSKGEKDRLIEIAHRRWGKDEIALNVTREKALARPANYWHCLPEYAQARKALWDAVNPHTGQRRILEAFPPEIIDGKPHDQEMRIKLINGATWQLIGSDRYDATVGSSPAGIVYSEWALANPSAWGYHRPMIQENNGWAAFITTPRGNNHAKSMYDMACKSDNWFAELSSVIDTGALSEPDQAEALAEYQALYGIEVGRAMFEQEYFCSFSGAMVGAYFGAEMNRADRERLQPVAIDWDHPVHIVMDLGKAVNNPCWIFQVIKDSLRIVDFYEPQSEDLDDWLSWFKDKGYNGNIYVPHDILVTEWGSGKTRMDLLSSKWGSGKVKRIARVSVADGLQAGRMAINKAVFHVTEDDRGVRVEHGTEGLRNYRREWDDERKTFREVPVKDWAEHMGSAWRYLGLAWREVVPPVVKPSKPQELTYTANADGSVTANMSVKEDVERKMRERRARE